MGKVDPNNPAVARCRMRRITKQTLPFRIRLNASDMIPRPSRDPKVSQCRVIDGEETASRPVFRRHVRQRCPFWNAKVRNRRPKELHRAILYVFPAQLFGDEKRQVGCIAVFRQRVLQADADYLGQGKHIWLTEQGGLCIDAANAPT